MSSDSSLMAGGQRNQSTSYLRPIQEVNTEQSKIDSMASSNYNRMSSNVTARQMQPSSSLISASQSGRTNYTPIDPNDGKSS